MANLAAQPNATGRPGRHGPLADGYTAWLDKGTSTVLQKPEPLPPTADAGCSPLGRATDWITAEIAWE